jgi:soluble lytic murein transglycosylase
MRRVDDGHQALAQARLVLQANTGSIEAALAKVPPALQRDPGLLYDRIHWNRVKGYNQQAVDLLLQAPAELIRPDLWWNEREIQIRYAIAANDDALAFRLATGHGLTTGTEYVQAEFMTGWIAFRMMHQPDVALKHFAAGFAASKTQSGIARNAYWAGRAAEEIPDPVGATGWYVKAADDLTSFYGQLAAAKLALPEAVRLPPEPVPTAEQIAVFNNREVTKLVHRLVEVGAPERIDPFLLRLAEIAASPQDAEQVAALARSAGRADLAVNVARRVQRDGILLVDSSYPILPPNIVGSDTGDAESALIHALIRQESGFASTAVSKVGAQGLMQLMPATAKSVAAKLNLPFSPVRLLHDQGYNAQIGQAFMGSILNNFSGSYLLSVAAYNAGPGRVRQWLQDIGDPRDGHMEAVDWIERVPFGETRVYIQRVLEALQIYRIRLNKGNAMAFGTFAAEPAAGSPWCLIACSAAVAAPISNRVD